MPDARADFANFITRSGDTLRDGGEVYQFIGYNFSGVMSQVDKGYWGAHSDWEYIDLLDTCNQMGIEVLRAYTIPVGTVSGDYTFVTGLRAYREENLRRLDRFLQLAAQRNVRLILPFIDYHSFRGGIAEFAGFRGKSASQFFTDATVKQDFKDLMYDVVNRVNSYTGVAYKNDKTILAWQLGNELDIGGSWSAAWEVEMATYIKTIESNHLVMSGAHKLLHPNSVLLSDPNIDVMAVHPYSYFGRPLVTYSSNYVTECDGLKPFIVDEFDDANVSNINTMLAKMTPNPHFAGALQWQLKPHTDIGGFYKRLQGSTNWYSYNWPGGQAGEAANGEITKVNLMRQYAHSVKGLAVPSVPVPPAPALLEGSSKHAVRLRGAVGARTYEMQRGTTASGPWTTLTTTHSDYGNGYDFGTLVPYTPFDDVAAPAGPVWYRARGANSDGVYGPFSGVIGIEDVALVEVDNGDPAGVWTVGSWISGTATPGYVGSDYWHDGNTGATGGKRVDYTPFLPVTGNYRVYLNYTSHTNRAPNAPIDIVHAGGVSTFAVDQRSGGGSLVPIGTTFPFAAGTQGTVRVRNDGANGVVVADAVVFVQESPGSSVTQQDNPVANGSGVTGVWTASTATPGYVGTNYLQDGNTGSTGGKSVQYTVNAPVTGYYKVYVNYTSHANRATNVPVDIIHAGGTTTVLVNQQTGGGAFVDLGGVYLLNSGVSASVIVRNDGANGYVVADAVKWVLQ